MTTARIKRGATLRWSVRLRSASGYGADMTGATVTSQIRAASGTLLQALTVDASGAAQGLFVLSATAEQTAGWAAGSYVCDVRIVQDGQVTPTETFGVEVVAAVTV